MERRKLLSICIPTFNEAETVGNAIAAVELIFNGPLSRYDLELIITDNASTDSTWEKIQVLAKTREHLRAFQFSRNFGYQNSVFAGLSLAKGDAVVELDADLEDPPEVIPKFVELWEQGNDVVYGVRRSRHLSFLKTALFSVFYRVLNRLSDIRIPENAGDFRLLDRKVVNVLKNLPERNLYLRGLVSFLGFRQSPVIYDRNPRFAGKSKFRFFHYFVLAVDALTAFSKTPLRMTGVMGILLFLFSAGLGTYYLLGKILFGVPVQGFTTLVVLMLFFHSVTFIVLGILGEYLSRIFDDSKFRPRVVIQEAIHAKDYPETL